MGIPVGVSACVMGQKVRFDGGHKRNLFVEEQLVEYFDFQPICPEVGIGLPVPRPTIRLLQRSDGEERLVATKDITKDYTDEMIIFSDKKISGLDNLCGYVVCAKSPTCGMERVKLYIENGNTVPGGSAGVYTRRLMETMPWLPVEEDGRLQDPFLRENFVFRVFTLNDFYQTMGGEPTRGKLINFHSRYKLVLMAHCPEAYKALGRMVADISNWDIDEFYHEYRLLFMEAIKNRANRRNNTNVLMHLQGYFKRYLDKEQKAELAEIIMDYRHGNMPLLAALTLINHHLRMHPDDYLKDQVFLNPYPQELKLRYAM
ncbi:hypothetical protein A3K86_21710 [Photobacterium jeanii]|uniref:DUF1722 domain-containing protein n=1 Tax=Photobacterium jeanii TaxID=858640 RepID=A0A178K367_9GAMM|nr:DUF523 and DUF1722 domain-containing protein [Photobacterium jeanii]OAN11546.1 hypothetical protein A3K86_21710 [Photobacterium jeanii]PST91065.1 DUF1722 domain-containing protein [Photobacterium jeanii]